jgi:hypothetical protein
MTTHKPWSLLDTPPSELWKPPTLPIKPGQTPTEWALENGLVYWIAPKRYKLTEKGISGFMAAGASREKVADLIFVDSGDRGLVESQPKPVSK